GTTNLCYVDYNLTSNTWGSAKTLTNVDTNSNTQISAITYSKTVDGKQVILVSCPTGSYSGGSNDSSASARLNGRIFVFTVEADGSLTKKSTVVVNDNESQFMYSCLTERSDGSVAILFEDKESAWGTGDNYYYTMDMKAFSSSDLGVAFDDGSGSVTPDPTPENPDDAYELTLELGQSATVTVSETEMVGTDGSFVSDDGKVKYVVKHYGSTSKYQQDTDGVDSGSKYLIVCSGSYAVTTSSSSNNDWYVYSLPLRSVSFNGSETNYLWTITETVGGYYIQNPDGQYMTFQTTYYNDDNNVTLSSTPFVCDITKSGNGYMIFADGTNIGLNNAGGSNKTAHGWPSSDNTVWSLYKYEQQGGTEVEFTGLDVTEGTKVTVGNVEYTVVVEPIESTESVFVLNSAQKTLDAVSDLGLTGSGYTVSYEIIQDENSIITLNGATVIADESNNGVAKVRATVKNSNGATVGTVEYTVSVSDVVVTDTKSVFLPKGGSATIEGLTGEIITSMLDTGIATVAPSTGTLSDTDVVITGVDVGMTSIVVGTVQFVIHVNPGTETTNNSSKYIYIYVDEILNCNVYYSINAGALHKIEGTGILIDQTYIGGFSIMFFASPFDGYALTSMGITNSAGEYYALSNGENKDGSDSAAWPFDSPTQTTVPT
ncbi:MAG: exo-alpha-sialidase, partial [Clostridia bacterium]|nr:exo-alpha-sialidase [Clostridia bacterium]